jgi:hypothetical protein
MSIAAIGATVQNVASQSVQSSTKPDGDGDHGVETKSATTSQASAATSSLSPMQKLQQGLPVYG